MSIENLDRAFRVGTAATAVAVPFAASIENTAAQDTTYNSESGVLTVADSYQSNEPISLATFSSSEYKDTRLTQGQEFPVLKVHKAGVLGVIDMYEHLGQRLSPEQFNDVFRNKDSRLNSAVQDEVEHVMQLVQNSNIAGPDIGINIVDDEDGVYAVVNFGAEQFNLGSGESTKVELLVPYDQGFVMIDDPDNEAGEYEVGFEIINNENSDKVALPVLVQKVGDLEYVTGFYTNDGTVQQIPLEVNRKTQLVGGIVIVKGPVSGLVQAYSEPGGNQYVGDVSNLTSFNVLDQRDGYFLIDEPFGKVRGWIPEGVVKPYDHLNTDLRSNLLSGYDANDQINFPRLSNGITESQIEVTPTGARGRNLTENELRALNADYKAGIEIDTQAGKVQIVTTIEGYSDLFYNVDYESLDNALSQIIDPKLVPTNAYTIRVEVRSPEDVDEILSMKSHIITSLKYIEDNGEDVLQDAYFTPIINNQTDIITYPILINKGAFDQMGSHGLSEFQYIGEQSSADRALSIRILSSITTKYNMRVEDAIAWSEGMNNPNFLKFYETHYSSSD